MPPVDGAYRTVGVEMSHQALNVDTLASAIRDLGPVFQTKDVSEHASVLDAHTDLSTHSHYHAFVGKALMLHHVQLGIVHAGESKPRGAVWRKQPSEPATQAPSSTDTAPAASEDVPSPRGLGPQYSGDSAFQARMRQHQSWYRDQVSSVCRMASALALRESHSATCSLGRTARRATTF